MIDEDDEPELVKALFDQLVKAPIKTFCRGCRDVPNEEGVYVIYGPYPWDVRYVGRTHRAVLRVPFRRGLRRRLSNHKAKYAPKHCSFRFLVVKDPRQRALLEAYATGHLCPADIRVGKIGELDDDSSS